MPLDPPKHPNSFEHKENLIKFLGYFVIYGILGGIIGRLIDTLISNAKGLREDKGTAALCVVLQILLNGVFFYAVFQLYTFKFGSIILTFDDWISSTFQGLIFATTVYSVQEQLAINFKTLLN